MRTTRIVALATVVLIALVALPDVSAGLPMVQYPRPPDLGLDPDDVYETIEETYETIANLTG